MITVVLDYRITNSLSDLQSYHKNLNQYLGSIWGYQ